MNTDKYLQILNSEDNGSIVKIEDGKFKVFNSHYDDIEGYDPETPYNRTFLDDIIDFCLIMCCMTIFVVVIQ